MLLALLAPIFWLGVGVVFTPLTDVRSDCSLSGALAIDFSNSKDGIVGGAGTISSTHDGGDTWNVAYRQSLFGSLAGTEFFHEVDAGNEEMAFAASYRALLKSEDRGDSWRPLFESNAETVHWFEFRPPEAVVLLTSDQVKVSPDGGESWSDVQLPPSALRHAWSVCMFGERLVLGCDNGDVYTTEEPGAAWELRRSGECTLPAHTPSHLRRPSKEMLVVNALSIDPSGTGFAVDWTGGVFRTDDGGLSWTTVRCPLMVYGWAPKDSRLPGRTAADSFVGGYPRRSVVVDASRVFLLAEAKLYYTVDGGSEWRQASVLEDDGSPSTANYFGVSVVDESVGWLIAMAGELYRTEDGGASWRRMSYRIAPGLQ